MMLLLFLLVQFVVGDDDDDVVVDVDVVNSDANEEHLSSEKCLLQIQPPMVTSTVKSWAAWVAEKAGQV